MVEAWAIKIVKNSSDLEKVTDPNLVIDSETYLKVWKKIFIKLVI
jgi:hypothetical protein